MAKFIFNKEELRFDERKLSFWRGLGIAVKYLILSILVAAGFYAVFVLCVNTDREKKIIAENKYLEQEYAGMAEKVDIIDNVITNLQIKDKEIYNNVFNADPPELVLSGKTAKDNNIDDIYAEEETNLIWDSHVKGIKLDNTIVHVNEWIGNINNKLSELGENVSAIPAIIPVKNFSIAQTGASIGQKVNPFYKTIRDHTGIDLLSPVGTEVLCSANGIVERITRSSKGFGNKIVINHGNGIQTTYSHLSDILVRERQVVRQGAVIGRVGSSGTAFAPHLHYEVIKDNVAVEPINYFFAGLTPVTYHEMMMIALNTGQSMD
ncbi:MAG: M23 family metallopeptidase [Bacteroidales bacterium]|nr:M23 family metallopeptidase [Bacteroidales bacterium]MDD4669513.1 M23 family metallopeptidase [Bacteroidales bacterium]